MLPSRWWAELAATDIAPADMAAQIAVLALAATEQHGPHLPLGTDTFIAEGYLARAVARLPPDLPGVVLPVQTVGFSLEHSDFVGTLSLPARTALDAWASLIDAVARTGCRKLVLISSHGGNAPLVDLLAQEGRARHRMLIVRAAWARFGYPDGLFAPAELAHGIHGGAVETALMLAFRPDLVRLDRIAPAAEPASVGLERDCTWLRAYGRPTGFGWMAQDLARSGVAGDAAAATREKGEHCADWGADAFVALLRDVQRFDLARLDERGTD